jgi:RNA polymerase sigma factor (sigma-70 family)
VTRKPEYRIRVLQETRRWIGRLTRRPLDIADLSHEALMRACTAERNRPLEQPRAVLSRIAHRQAVSTLEGRARQISEYLEDSGGSKVVGRTTTDEEIQVRKLLGLHCAAVAGLIPQCRHVYLLRKVHGLSHQDIAEQLRISASAVREHLIRAVQHCDRYLCDKADSERAHIAQWNERDRCVSARRTKRNKPGGLRLWSTSRLYSSQEPV